MILGEALVDLLETRIGDEVVYRPAVGGAPLNVAVGIARLGGRAEFAGSLGDDAFGRRIGGFLRDAGVGTRGVRIVDAPTTLAVTTFEGTDPHFRFYGEPPSYGLLGPTDLDPAAVRDAAVVYCGSIALLTEPVLAAARRAWAIAGPVRTFDPNIRPSLKADPRAVRRIVEEFAATADLVKLSGADAKALYGAPPRAAAERLAGLGAATVVVTLGPQGALVVTGDQFAVVTGFPVAAIDTTGAGDATMAGLLAGILADGLPDDLSGWVRLTDEAMRVAALVCEAPGGATAMPTRDQVRRRFE